jgi:glycosyltransferase involved in cell wall biosynthesis
MTPRAAIVTEILAPYRIPVFNALAEQLGGGLHVIFLAETEPRRSWAVPREEIRFSYEVLRGLRFTVPYRGDRQPVYLAPPLVGRLERGGFDAVLVGGWNHLECYETLAWCRSRGRRFALWSETPLLGELPARPLRTVLKRVVVSRADAFAVPGPSAGRYLAALGAEPTRIHEAPNAVDVAFWSEGPGGPPPGGRLSLLLVARLVASKGVDLALRAFAASRLAGRADLLVAGDGPQRVALERLAAPGVRFLGEQDRGALRTLYHGADLLVFPSRYDPWGLVVNEAACAGLPAIASDGAGASRDLVRDGENGLLVAAGSERSLREAFDRVADDPGLPARLRPGAAEIARTHRPEDCAAGLREALA